MKKASSSHIAKANIVEHDQGFKSKNSKTGKGGISKKLKFQKKFQPKFQGKCYNCNTNVVDKITQDVSEINLFVVVSEVNLVESNRKEW